MRRLIIEPPAQADERLILLRSRQLHGAAAMHAYASLMRHAYKLLQENPKRPGVHHREDLSGAPFLFHLRHARRRGQSPKHPRHFILFRHDKQRVHVLRVLHDSMDIDQHVGGEKTGS